MDPKQNFLEFFDKDNFPPISCNAPDGGSGKNFPSFGMHLSLRSAPRYIGTEDIDDANQALVTHLGVSDTQEILTNYHDMEDGKLPGHPHGHIT